MPHSLAAHAACCDFHAATVADLVFKPYALVFSACAFVVAYRSENSLAEKAARFGFESAVVDSLGIFDFAVRPRTYSVGRGESYRNAIETRFRIKTQNFARLSLICLIGIVFFHTKKIPILKLALESARYLFSASLFSGLILRHRPCISFINTLKDCGVPACKELSPFTSCSYILVLPWTSSDFTVNSSCNV